MTEENFPVEHQHEMRDVAEDEDPQGPGPLARIVALDRVRRLEQLLQSEDDAGKVRDEEEEDDGHEDHGQIVLEAASIGIAHRS